MVTTALESIRNGHVMCGDFATAISHIDAIHSGRLLSCREIFLRYSKHVEAAVSQMRADRNVDIGPEWLYAIIKLETGGIVRPRFEQHVLSRLHRNHPTLDFAELRFRSMSQGPGQVLGENYLSVGARSAMEMYMSPLSDQILFVARFLAHRHHPVARRRPTAKDFRTIARFYNGRGYARHHYHEQLDRWHREFRKIIS
jgi:hypothetical protein